MAVARPRGDCASLTSLVAGKVFASAYSVLLEDSASHIRQ